MHFSNFARGSTTIAITTVALIATTANAALDNINYGAFTKSGSFAIAQTLGFFTHFNVNVTYFQVPNSTVAYNNLASGSYDVLSGAIDNIVNRRFNFNLSFSALGQTDSGLGLVLAGRPDITSVYQLKGKPLMVDSPISGYAYALQKVMAYYGLRLNRDYTFQTVGGTNLRYADLISGMLPNGSATYGTIISYPFLPEIRPLPAGQQINNLAKVSDFIQPYASSVLTVSSPILTTSSLAKLTRFTAALLSSTRFLSKPTNKQCAIYAIAQTLNITTDQATTAYGIVTDPLTGETNSPGNNYTVNRQGLLNVIDVRDQFGGFAQLYAQDPNFSFEMGIMPGPGKLIDYSVRDAAVMAGLWDPKCVCVGSLGCRVI